MDGSKIMSELSPRDILERLFRRWPLIALGVLLGGLLGLLSSRLLPPVYEAHAEIYVNLDSALWAQENHVGNPSEVAVSGSMMPISDLFYADETLRVLVAAAGEENLSIEQGTVLDTFTIQRINMTWQMTVRADDPHRAARLADLWVQTALPIHQTAHEHALAAYALTLERDALVICFEGSSLTAGNTCAGTSFAALAELEPALTGLDTRITAERSQSMGLDPALTIEPGPGAEVPSEPVHHQRTWLALAGMMIGLILGVFASQSTVPAWKKNVRKG
jgi:Chain length determinant protein